MPMDLVLVRHGESVGNVALNRAKSGGAVPPADSQFSSRRWRLTPRGQHQAQLAGEWLRSNGLNDFDRYYCSPYVRTMQTAALLDLASARWWLESLLRERDRGYEYVAGRDEIARQFRDSTRARHADPFLWRPTGGESIPDVDLRTRAMLGTFARELDGASVICVTHEDAMDAARFRLEKLTIAEWTHPDRKDHEQIPNGGILHYSRRSPFDSSRQESKFGWVRLVDPGGDRGFDWREISRPRYSNGDLLDAVRAEGVDDIGNGL